jgi:hypothetical protein
MSASTCRRFASCCDLNGPHLGAKTATYTGSTRTAANFSSGSFERGSNASLVASPATLRSFHSAP